MLVDIPHHATSTTSNSSSSSMSFSRFIFCASRRLLVCALFPPKRCFLFVWKNYHKYICIYSTFFLFGLRCVRKHFAWSFVCMIVSLFSTFFSRCCASFCFGCCFLSFRGVAWTSDCVYGIHTNTLPSKMKINLISTVALSYIHHSHSCIAFLLWFHVLRYDDTYVNFTLQNMRLHSKITIAYISWPEKWRIENESTRVTQREQDMAKKIVTQIMNCNFNFGLTVMRMTKANLMHKVQMTKR